MLTNLTTEKHTIQVFTQNHLASFKLTYEAIKDIVCENQDPRIDYGFSGQ